MYGLSSQPSHSQHSHTYMVTTCRSCFLVLFFQMGIFQWKGIVATIYDSKGNFRSQEAA